MTKHVLKFRDFLAARDYCLQNWVDFVKCYIGNQRWIITAKGSVISDPPRI